MITKTTDELIEELFSKKWKDTNPPPGLDYRLFFVYKSQYKRNLLTDKAKRTILLNFGYKIAEQEKWHADRT